MNINNHYKDSFIYRGSLPRKKIPDTTANPHQDLIRRLKYEGIDAVLRDLDSGATNLPQAKTNIASYQFIASTPPYNGQAVVIIRCVNGILLPTYRPEDNDSVFRAVSAIAENIDVEDPGENQRVLEVLRKAFAQCIRL